MSDAAEMMGRIHSMRQSISESLDGFGGFLRCESCGNQRDLKTGDAGNYTATGWPKCCNLTMRWWTQNQIDSGEAP
jgi:hypothetical protein